MSTATRLLFATALVTVASGFAIVAFDRDEEATAAEPPRSSEAAMPADDGSVLAAGAEGDDEAEDEQEEPAPLHLRAPTQVEPLDVPPYVGTIPEDAYRKAYAWQFDAPIFDGPEAGASIIGLARRHTLHEVARWVPGDGCGQSWYELSTGGYVCSSEGFSVATSPTPLEGDLHVRAPSVEHPVPYEYAKVETENAPLYSRVPTLEEEERATVVGSAAPPVREWLDGARFVAIDEVLERDGRRFVKTIRGGYLREEHIRRLDPPKMVGEHLDEAGLEQPIAFVYGDEISLLDPESEAVVGTADKHARFRLLPDQALDEENALLESTDGFSVRRSEVRIAQAIRRPKRIPEGTQWVHVDLGDQVLVAYEGDTPVFATLVSSGKPGHEPPKGVFRVHKKYLSKTMAGDDEVDGYYEVAQVPWTLYYWGSFAIHGAYWHDDFGVVKSHGCTNVSPPDARWLFYWASPELPTGWHGRIGRKGTYLHYTG